MRPLPLLALLVLALPTTLALPPMPCGLPGGACALPDPSFERTDGFPSGWAPYVSGPCDGSGVAPSAAAARTGASGIRIVDRDDLCTGVYTVDALPLVGGMEYNASVQVRAPEGAPAIRIFVVWYGNDGSNLGDYLYKDGFEARPGAAWEPLWSRTLAPPDAQTARILLYAPMAGAGTIDLDDAAFEGGLPTQVPPLV